MSEQFDEYGEFVDEGTGEILHEYPSNPYAPVRRHIVFEPDYTAAGHITERLSRAILAVEGRIPLRGKNKQQDFTFATSEDIKAAARAALAENQLSVVMGVVGPPEVGPHPKNYSGWGFYTVEYEIVLMAPEGIMRIPYFALALDNSDKGIAKTLTTGMKYFLITLLQIPRGDEPDTDATEISEEDKKPPRQSGRRSGQSGRQSGQSGSRQPQSEKPASTATKDKADGGSATKPWPKETIDAILKRDFVPGAKRESIEYLLNLSEVINQDTPADVAIDWVACYKGHKDAGKTSADAVKMTDQAIRQQMDAGADIDKWIAENAGVIPEEKEKSK